MTIKERLKYIIFGVSFLAFFFTYIIPIYKKNLKEINNHPHTVENRYSAELRNGEIFVIEISSTSSTSTFGSCSSSSSTSSSSTTSQPPETV